MSLQRGGGRTAPQFAAVGAAGKSRQTTSPPLSRMAIASVVPRKPFAPVTVWLV